MSLSKRKITEEEAAEEFVRSIIGEAENVWPELYKKIQKLFPRKFIVKDETKAALDLSLAVIAVELQCLENLFPQEQAVRIKQWSLHLIKGALKVFGSYPITEIEQYQRDFKEDPINKTSAHLFSRWVGEDIKEFTVKIEGQKTNTIDPLYLLPVSFMLASFLGYWKRVKDGIELMPSDTSLMPSEKDIEEMRKFTEISNNTVPFVYYDEHGCQQEQWVTPERLKELSINSSKKFYRVLLKGAWDGDKEALMEITDDTVSKFVDEKKCIYAFRACENGQPKYMFVKKVIWEKSREVLNMVMTSGMSDGMVIKSIQKLTDDN